MSWNPDAKRVSSKEYLGRRAFGEVSSVFEQAQPVQYRLDLFLDSRLEDDLSFDRLGIKRSSNWSPDATLVAELEPKCVEEGAARKPSKKFRGWAIIHMTQISAHDVRPRPIEGNKYHAELSRALFRLTLQARTLAFELREHARQNPFIPASAESAAPDS